MAGKVALSLGYLVVGCCLVTAVCGGTLACRQEGRFPHPQNCGSYVDCLRTGEGVLQAREGHCHGYPFSAEKRRCVDHSEKPDCVTKGTRNNTPAPDFKYKCVIDENAVGCINCNSTFACINGNAKVDFCDEFSVCNTSSLFGGSVCLPIASLKSDICACNKLGLITDPFNGTYFHFCDSIGGIPETFACELGSKFNDITYKCEAHGPPQTPSCEGKFGTFVNPNDCSYYYSCIPGGNVRTGSCDPEQYFNQTSGVCATNCDFGKVTPVVECNKLGFFPHPSDCTKYLACKVKDELPEETSCYPGFYFNEDTKRCSDTTAPDTCQGGFDYLSCPGHKELTCP